MTLWPILPDLGRLLNTTLSLTAAATGYAALLGGENEGRGGGRDCGNWGGREVEGEA